MVQITRKYNVDLKINKPTDLLGSGLKNTTNTRMITMDSVNGGEHFHFDFTTHCNIISNIYLPTAIDSFLNKRIINQQL